MPIEVTDPSIIRPALDKGFAEGYAQGFAEGLAEARVQARDRARLEAFAELLTCIARADDPR